MAVFIVRFPHQGRCNSAFYMWCAQLHSTSTPLFTIFMWHTKSYLSPPSPPPTRQLRLLGGPCVPAKTSVVPYRSGTVGIPQEWECGRRWSWHFWIRRLQKLFTGISIPALLSRTKEVLGYEFSVTASRFVNLESLLSPRPELVGIT